MLTGIQYTVLHAFFSSREVFRDRFNTHSIISKFVT